MLYAQVNITQEQYERGIKHGGYLAQEDYDDVFGNDWDQSKVVYPAVYEVDEDTYVCNFSYGDNYFGEDY